MKLVVLNLPPKPLRRAPYGARGLKFWFVAFAFGTVLSRPVWGAWIEINLSTL